MELSFEYFGFLKILDETPEIMIFATAFGTPILMLIISPIAKLYRSSPVKETINMILFGSLTIGWIGGFVLMIILSFGDISGIKLFLIWILWIITVFFFVGANNKTLLKLYNSEIKERINKDKDSG
ncbi:hypothetical protein [Aquimarina pacifica]|uniref:hypothetical protein n=1 Tax=Aquimarina pacifica TaxID=1296415 RepID=UPI00046FD596|nr:hypothetical protein [Aquimarina pacifica]